MTKPEFKVGDRVGTKDGRTWKVKQVNTESGALLLETEKDVKPYETTWFAGSTVTASRRRGKAPEPTPAPAVTPANPAVIEGQTAPTPTSGQA